MIIHLETNITLIPGSKLEVVRNFDYSLSDIEYVYSCRFMFVSNSKQVHVALSGRGSDNTYIFNVSKQIRHLTKSKSSKKRPSNQFEICSTISFYCKIYNNTYWILESLKLTFWNLSTGYFSNVNIVKNYMKLQAQVLSDADKGISCILIWKEYPLL